MRGLIGGAALAAFLAVTTGARAAAPSASPATEAVTITVKAGARQSFAGFGASLGNWGGEYQSLKAAEREKLNTLLWSDLRFRSLRLWFAPQPGAHDLSAFRRSYVDSGIIADAKKHGVTDLLLAPDGLPEGMIARDAEGHPSFKPGQEAEYARLIADFITRLKDETGVLLTVTGIQNEPNDNERFAPEQIVLVVKRLRGELDRRGLQSVRIIAPESANVDGVFYDTVDLMKADPTAWKALSGVASHSYTMAATEDAAKRVANTGKAYWMTEAGDNGPEVPGDPNRAVSLAGRFLNDMNHRVTHWVHFIGFEVADPNDNATRILAYQAKPFAVTTFLKWFYYRQLSRAFDVGAVFRQSDSSLDGGMTYTYGKKPHLIAAAGRNPDGSWAFGAANLTSPEFTDVMKNEKGEPSQTSYAARGYRVTVRIPELERVERLDFRVRRSGPARNGANALQEDREDGVLTLKRGLGEVTVGPRELVTLHSTPMPKGRRARP